MNYDDVLRSILNRVHVARHKILMDNRLPKVVVLEDIEYQMILNDHPDRVQQASDGPVLVYGIPVVPVSEAIFLPREI